MLKLTTTRLYSYMEEFCQKCGKKSSKEILFWIAKNQNMIQAELVHLIIIFAILIPVLFAGRTGFPYLVVIGSVFSAV